MTTRGEHVLTANELLEVSAAADFIDLVYDILLKVCDAGEGLTLSAGGCEALCAAAGRHAEALRAVEKAA